MFAKETWTVIHGSSCFPYTKKCIESFSKFKMNIIWSSWKDTPQDVIDLLIEKGIPYVLDDYPAVEGMSKLNYQRTGFLNGLKLAREKGAKYIYKCRTDLDIVNFPLMINSLYNQAEFDGKVNLLCWDELCSGVCDFCMFGPIDEMELYWSFPDINCPSERCILPQYFKAKGWEYTPEYNYVKKFVNFHIQTLDYLRVIINWFKNLEESPLTEHFANRAIYK